MTSDQTKDVVEDMQMAELQAEYEAELVRFNKQKLLIDIIKEMNVDKMHEIGAESKENVTKAIDHLHMMDYLKMNNSNLNVLGKNDSLFSNVLSRKS